MSAVKRAMEEMSVNMGRDGLIDDDVLDAFNREQRELQTISSAEIGDMSDLFDKTGSMNPLSKPETGVRSLDPVEKERELYTEGSIEYRVLTCFLCPTEVGPHADRLRTINYNDENDYMMFRQAVASDYRKCVFDQIGPAEREKAERVYQLGWDLFKGVLPIKKVKSPDEQLLVELLGPDWRNQDLTTQ